ncbi:hypothetical protein BOSE62_70920 [Bosea sp. 62]|nr:hypothetical protein BOSE7B_50763 [Bosea sp. 7B]CAD5297973.1 hypothetical protein BOSE21B_90730 [Bosea sp. 21B]CAD5298142.1 hypothetical protein BOSE46_80805 [Bosea sp. 46]VVT61377.1 hypothetical protein BOS5A_230654 [Bosea sp. EC-HK365B]VXB17678.1 hypothetical protein BOSE127_100434 [Bosea sp. 127]VXB25989.1 hypothetical protein BOSE125_130330 [Bosea sp. 125]VXC83001.1 hypothetical protein BOSE29B_80690 [Bosea sp. 29B]VXC83653.1 hypothetical protein BOSE62_70920 [Bosea sp. 62]
MLQGAVSALQERVFASLSGIFESKDKVNCLVLEFETPSSIDLTPMGQRRFELMDQGVAGDFRHVFALYHP